MWGGPVTSRQPWPGQGHRGCHEVSTQCFTQPLPGFTIQLRMLAGCFSACCVALPATGRGFLGTESRSCTSRAAQLAERDPKVPSNSSPSQRSLCKPFLRADRSPCRAVLLPSCSHSSPRGCLHAPAPTAASFLSGAVTQAGAVTQSWL